MNDVPKDSKLVCFLCGDALEADDFINNEHIFPEWLLSRFHKQNQFAVSHGLERQRQQFFRHKIRVHEHCNSIFGRQLEVPMSKYTYDSDVLWIWCLKIIVGIRFHEFGFDLIRNEPGYETNRTLWEYPDDLNNFWELGPQLLINGAFKNTAMYSVIELDFLFAEPSFYYKIHHELGIMWLALGNRSFLLFYNAFVGDDVSDQYLEIWSNVKREHVLSPESCSAQFAYNLFCAQVSIHRYFSTQSQAFDFSNNGGWIQTRSEWSEELEDEFYKFFDIKPVRDGRHIISWRSIG